MNFSASFASVSLSSVFGGEGRGEEVHNSAIYFTENSKDLKNCWRNQPKPNDCASLQQHEKEQLVMKMNIYCSVVALGLQTLLLTAPAEAQTYTINWHEIAGGGGTSTGTGDGGSYSVTGTIGQPAAAGSMSGGNYSLTSGFWSALTALQSPDAPKLSITNSGTNVLISWPNTGNFQLQQNANPASPASWQISTLPVSSLNGTNRVTISQPTGILFFRLAAP